MKIGANELKQLIREEILKESGYTRLRRIFAGQVDAVNTVGIITAENPHNITMPRTFNEQQNAKLKNDLKAGNFGFVQINGMYDNYEKPFVVMNIDRSKLCELGIFYEQESVLWGQKIQSEDHIGFRFEYIQGDETKKVRDVLISGEKIRDSDNYYSNVGASKFQIPFFDDDTENLKMSKTGEIVDSENKSLVKEVYDDIVRRMGKVTGEKWTGRSKWENRGMLRHILRENNANFFD